MNITCIFLALNADVQTSKPLKLKRSQEDEEGVGKIIDFHARKAVDTGFHMYREKLGAGGNNSVVEVQIIFQESESTSLIAILSNWCMKI